AQGAMAVLATFVAYALINRGMSYWIALPVTLVLAFGGGIVIQRVVIRPVEKAPILTLVIITLGLATLLNGLAGFIFGYVPRSFPSAFSAQTIDLLEPNMMQSIIIYAFAAAVLGGIESPIGAVVGGLIVGVTVNLAGAYLPFVGGDLQLAVGLAIIIVVLIIRPNGLFGRAAARR